MSAAKQILAIKSVLLAFDVPVIRAVFQLSEVILARKSWLSYFYHVILTVPT